MIMKAFCGEALSPRGYCISASVWPQVRDKNNYDFLTKLLIKIGARVPASGDTEAALVHVAKKHSLLGDDITAATLQVWGNDLALYMRGVP